MQGVPFQVQMQSIRLYFYEFIMTACRLLSFMYVLNMEVMSKINYEQNNRSYPCEVP